MVGFLISRKGKFIDHRKELSLIGHYYTPGPEDDRWGGDSHCLWLRVYPSAGWCLPRKIKQENTKNNNKKNRNEKGHKKEK